MTKLTLPALFTLLATQAAAHTDNIVHLHTTETLPLVAVLSISFGLLALSLGAAALVRAKTK